jgi:hypothetical protein
MKYLISIHVLVLTLIKCNQYQRVKDLLHKYTIIQPDNAQVFCLMAHILQETHDTDQAKSWFVIRRMLIDSKSFIQVFTSLDYSSNRWAFTSTNR